MGASCTVQLYLVRHGITSWNKEKRYLGHTDIEVLSDELYLFEPLKKVLNEERFSQIYCSDLLRCRQTLAYLFKEQAHVWDKVVFDSRLREIHFGKWEGKTYHDLKEDILYQQWLEEWHRALPQSAPPKGESGAAFSTRIDTFLKEWLTSLEKEYLEQSFDPKSMLFLSHGGVIRYVLNYFIPEYSFWQWEINHGRAYRLDLARVEEGWNCYSWLEVPTQENGELCGIE